MHNLVLHLLSKFYAYIISASWVMTILLKVIFLNQAFSGKISYIRCYSFKQLHSCLFFLLQIDSSIDGRTIGSATYWWIFKTWWRHVTLPSDFDDISNLFQKHAWKMLTSAKMSKVLDIFDHIFIFIIINLFSVGT